VRYWLCRTMVADVGREKNRVADVGWLYIHGNRWNFTAINWSLSWPYVVSGSLYNRIWVRVQEVIVNTRGQRKIRRPEQGRRLRKEAESYVVEP
jgi:hypothetical protein